MFLQALREDGVFELLFRRFLGEKCARFKLHAILRWKY
jgi:hypothetical protein